MHNEDLDDNLSKIFDTHNDFRDDNSESGNDPLWLPFRTLMGKQVSKDSCTGTLGNQVMPTPLTPMPAQPLHSECQEVCLVPDVEVE